MPPPPRVADDLECTLCGTSGIIAEETLFLLGSTSNGLESCSTERESDELSIDLEKAFSGDSVGLQSFGVVATLFVQRMRVNQVSCLLGDFVIMMNETLIMQHKEHSSSFDFPLIYPLSMFRLICSCKYYG